MPEVVSDPTVSLRLDAGDLTDVIAVVKTLVDECKVRFPEEGLSITAADPTNVGMVDLTLGAEAFESYNAPSDGSAIGVNLGRLGDIVGMAGAGESVHLALDAETRKLHINTDDLSYTMALIDPDAIRSEPSVPDLEEQQTASFSLSGRQFKRGIDAAALVSDHLTFHADPDPEPGAFEITAAGDTDDMELRLPPDELLAADAPSEEATVLSLNYVESVSKPTSNDTEVEVSFGTEFPVSFGYTFAEGAGEVRFLIAPRITS